MVNAVLRTRVRFLRIEIRSPGCDTCTSRKDVEVLSAPDRVSTACHPFPFSAAGVIPPCERKGNAKSSYLHDMLRGLWGREHKNDERAHPRVLALGWGRAPIGSGAAAAALAALAALATCATGGARAAAAFVRRIAGVADLTGRLGGLADLDGLGGEADAD